MQLSQYRLETLHQDGEFILYRGLRQTKTETSPPSILVLSPVMERPAPATIKKIEHEFSLKDELNPAWAIRPIALTQQQSRTILVFEDPNGEPLDRLLRQPMELKQVLRCGIALAAALCQVHRRGLIHKDIKPYNVLANGALDQAWLMGFGIASRLPRERQRAEPPELISGTLAYMAPEQTGRMNRSIDSRSDLYALGITLYELLTGSLPFTASDPMEWVHCHIARQPLAPAERLIDVPRPVSAIIMKLLAKAPEERYQTAAGVESDFRRCLEDWDRERGVHDFALGEHDRPDSLLIPEKLYGREHEIETLLASFDRVVKSGTQELVLVSGYSGIGKSSVINELHKVLVPPRGLFASGKFDQYKRDIPYSTLGQALQSLTGRLLAKSEAELATWRDAMREALDPNGQLIIDLVPELKLILGEQPQVPELPPQDAKRRFQLVLRRFIGVFARPEHPLALFLDDLQWLDSATLEALQDLLTKADVRNLLMIGAYRDNEVNTAHPLTRKLEGIRQAGASINEIKLGPLSQDDVVQLVTDALQCQPERVLPLARLVYEKTAGNPFFTIQFISALEQEKLLAFDHAHGRWSWDLGRIRAKEYTDNVANLMVGKLKRLRAETQKALQQLACLGNAATVTTLSLVYGTEKAQVHSDLSEAIRAEMVERQEGSYEFIHDRVQEAAYSLIPEAQRDEVHLRIGRLLLAHTPPGERGDAVFDIVNQLNRGAALITSQQEREQLAELNLMAGQRAKGSAAFASALTYLASGAALLTEDCWERRHDLAFALELNRAECEYSTGQPGSAEEHLSALATHADALGERAAIVCLRMDLYHTQAQQHRAIGVGLDFLRDMGIDWTPHPSEEEVRREYERIWSQLGTRAIEDLIELPVLSDALSIATLAVLAKLEIPAHATDNNLHGLVICRAVSLSIERGNCEASCYAYVWLGAIVGAQFGDYQAGYRFARIGYELGEQRGWKSLQPAAYLVFGSVILPWARHVKEGRDLMRRAIESGNSIGDLHHAVGSGPLLTTNMLAAGDHLADVERVARGYLEQSLKAGLGLTAEASAAQLALVRTLRGITPTFGCLNDEQFQEAAAEHRFAGNPNLQHAECWYWIRKLQARFFAGDYAAAIAFSSRAERLLWTAKVVFEAAEYHLYSALSLAAWCDTASPDGRQPHLEALALHQRQLDIWAENCPENFENRAALVGAEIARIEGRDLDAMRLYEKAIHSARTNGFVHNEAVAYERASAFYKARGFSQFADLYLRNARACYASWGADGKVRQLDQFYPGLKQEQPMPDPTSTITALVEGLDLATVIRVSQAVSGEIVLEKLVDTVMRKAMEHAGAERGLLILPHGDQLQVKAEATTDGDSVAVRTLEEPISAGAAAESVLRYVVRTHEQVIIDDASVPKSFSTDEYFRQTRTRSVACLPLLKQGELIALLYLENKLASNVFTPARLKTLEVLASQAAISLENSRLYHEIQRAEQAVRRSEKQLRDVIETMPAMAFTALPDGSTDFVSRRFSDFTGLTANDAGPHRRNTVHPEDLETHARKWQTCLATGEPFENEVRHRGKDGQYRWFLVRGLPLRDEDGNVLKWFGTLTDIEDRKQAEEKLRNENVALREEIDKASMFEEIVGTSRALQAVLSRISKVAPSDSTVLITGETGTGKELVARAIHRRSNRSSRAFVSVNCAAIPRDLIASELFGHEKGAFTGATQQRLGRFELGNGGTLFLDEVGELPSETQIALLRVLQEHEFERVGGTRPIRADVRVIAATNRDLEAAIGAGSFRSDLFYRLNVFPIEIPPLRERREDIPLLLEYFIDRYARKAGKHITTVDKRTLQVLQSYPWPGNIRELQNVIDRSVIVCETENFSVDESWLSRQPVASELTSRLELSRKFAAQEKAMIEAALRESRGQVSGSSGAAAKLGIPGSTLESKIRSLKINKNHFKTNPSADRT